MKIGIATCSDKPQLTAGDRSFADLLEAKGFQTTSIIWNEPDVLSNEWDAIIIRSTWDYHEDSDEFIKWISQIEQFSVRLINSADVIKWNLEKTYLLDLERQGLAIVPSLVISRVLSEIQILEAIQKSGWSHFVLKPTISATAFLTFKLSVTSAELPRCIAQIKKHSDIIVQPFIPSVETDGEISSIFFRSQSARYSHSVLKRPKAGDFRVQSDFGGEVIPFQPSKELVEYAMSCLQSIPGDWTFARVDLVDWKKKPLLSELELIEPDLFLTFDSGASQRFAEAVAENLRREPFL